MGGIDMRSVWHVSDSDFDKGPGAEHGGLRVELREAKRDAAGTGFEITFAVVNVGKTPARVYQRWNSWGAYQWRLAITGADGSHVYAGNPQLAWTRNGPSAVSIDPGKELALSAHVHPDRKYEFERGFDAFVADRKLAFPLRVRGVFDARPGEEPEPKVSLDGRTTIPSTELWSGAIASSWVDVP